MRRSTRRVLGIALLTLGLLALVYGGFTYTKDRHEVDLGPIEFGIDEKEHVQIPPWVGVVGIVAGAVLLVSGRK